jgi:hypothetical protein
VDQDPVSMHSNGHRPHDRPAATFVSVHYVVQVNIGRHRNFDLELLMPLYLCSLFVRYHVGVGNARTCAVSFVDSAGIRHSVEAAEWLYEAAALAVREFPSHPWVVDVESGATIPLSMRVKPQAPAT